nr:reverse transcriptase domain-containing protein [Tanacetum cinerariifolium]
MAFHTSHRVYCYTKMPFGLKNAGATYERLVDKAFNRQIGQNLEIYVDDLVIKSHMETKLLRDIEEMLCTLRQINMKLNLKKCTFRAAKGMFLGYMINPEGIKLCPDKTEAVLQLLSPRTIKEVQSLNGKLASLNRFISKSTGKYLPLFKTLKRCIKKSDFHWTPDAKQAFKQLKQHLAELPMLVASKPKEELIMYLSASYGVISAVLMTEKDTVQTPVYFVSRALQAPKLKYTPMEKLVLALVCAAKTLRRYFQAHPIVVITDQPIKQTLFMDGSLGINGSGARLILTSPKGTEFTYALRFQFTASNNEAEYEALIDGLWIAAQMGVYNVYVLVEILKEKSIQEKEMATVVEEEGPTWMTPIIEYLRDETLLENQKEASKLHIKAKKYELLEGILYRRLFLKPWLREIVTDNGKQFSGDPFKYWSLGKGIKARLGEGNKSWLKELPHVLWAHRTMIKSSNDDTLFSLTCGTEAVIPAEIGMPTYRTTVVDAAKAKSKMRKYYNARVRGVTFRPGDFVYHSNDTSHAVDGGKLGPKWEGPYEVMEALGDGAYKLRSTDGTFLPRT